MNYKLAVLKELIVDNNNEKYKKLIRIYKYLLEYYLSSKIDLSKYEEEIKNSNLYIGINPKYKNLNKYLDLNYIFLVNRLFVEKLSNDDINNLLKFDKDNIDNSLIEIINKTYKDVIYDNYLDEKYSDKIYKVCYGTFIPKNLVNNNALVFRIYYGKNLIELNGEKFKKLYLDQLTFLENIKNRIIKEVKEKLDIECEIIIEKDIY